MYRGIGALLRLILTFLAIWFTLGFALPLLRLYWKNGKVKAELGIGRGKTHRDQRYDLKARVELREAQREVTRFNKGY